MGAQIQQTPGWMGLKGTAYSMFLRPLVLPGNVQLAEWIQDVQVASPTFILLGLSRCHVPVFSLPLLTESHP